LDIDKVKNIDPIRIREVSNIDPVNIARIGPAAVHIKEVNHIDPLSIESLDVGSVRHVEPLQVEKLNITNLPSVNVTVRQAPPVDINIRRVPPLAIALQQRFQIPSEYLVRGQLFGIECFRLQITGCTTVIPEDRYRREISRPLNQSHPHVAVSGNAGIPSQCQETVSAVRSRCAGNQDAPSVTGPSQMQAAQVRPAATVSAGNGGVRSVASSVHVGQPSVGVRLR
jgi:hypothetical protein